MILGKLALWLLQNFDTCSYSLPLAHGRMRVTEHDVHMTLCLLKGPLEVDAASVPDIKRWINGEIKYRARQEFLIGFGRGYFEDTLDKMTITDKEKEVNEEKLRGKNDEDEAKAKDEIGVSKLKKAGTLTGPYHWEGFLMEIDAIEKHFVGSRDMVDDFPKFTPPSFTLGVSQEEKETLPEGVVIADSKPDILTVKVQVVNCDVRDILMRCTKSSTQCSSTPLPPGTFLVEDNQVFVGRSMMRIAEPDLEIQDVQRTTNANKGKAVVVEAPKRKSEEEVEAIKKHCEETDKKKKTNKTLRKKAKRVKYFEEVGKDDEFVQKCAEKEKVKESLVGKMEEKKMENVVEKASSKHPGIEESPKKPQQEEETLEESPSKSNKK
ncbi:hypothetical protein Cgig2_024098 [Carnegiea gigantea]|uniref:Uncharacterized protein n=1 Tax=Carnegiea gigantea TaxID=171969 RepID=A0A9Q1GQY7_9CARY|nr:hypothetical protein Cgig2_024098 [Carnegiea gigantea]